MIGVVRDACLAERTRPGVKGEARRVSGGPFRRSGALVRVARGFERGCAWLALSEKLNGCGTNPRAAADPALFRWGGRVAG